jgi:hypothetical protein
LKNTGIAATNSSFLQFVFGPLDENKTQRSICEILKVCVQVYYEICQI